MKNIIIALTISTFVVAATTATAKGNAPCSGKKGGVAHCTADGKFVCKNGSISKSKKRCR